MGQTGPFSTIEGEHSTLLTDNKPDLSSLSSLQQMMTMDILTYLPDDILTKVDRASMSQSLETRAPYLDKSVLEFAATLSDDTKLRNGQSKWILRQILEQYIPAKLTNRPKMGFAVPLDTW